MRNQVNGTPPSPAMPLHGHSIGREEAMSLDATQELEPPGEKPQTQITHAERAPAAPESAPHLR